MKKILTVVLCLSIVFTYSVGVYAADSPESAAVTQAKAEKRTHNEKKMNSDKSHLKSIGFTNVKAIDNFKGQGTTAYKLEMPNGVESYAKVNDTEEGIEYEFYEGDKHDIVCYLYDGRVKIDGVFVTDENGDAIRVGGDIMTRARYATHSSKPIKGKASNYDKYIQSTSDSWITFAKALATFTTAAMGSFICNLFGLEIAGEIFTGFGIGMATDVISNAKTSAPNSKVMSREYAIYEYVGGAATPLDHYYKYVAKCYVKGNLQGPAAKKNYYEYNYFA